MSPNPTTPAFSNTQSTSSLFSGVNTAPPAFGANGVNGVQQQTFAAPSASTFNFSASTGANPFAVAGASNPFSNPNTSNMFGQQAPAGMQQATTFGQSQLPQPTSNLFNAPGKFEFGRSTGVNNSFPPTQTTSIFSKSTPASGSFTFASNSSSSQTPAFTTAPQASASNGDIPMDPSESPLRSAAKSAAPSQPTESKLNPPIFSGSTSFPFKPTNGASPQDPRAQSPQPFGNLFQPKSSTADPQPPTQASSLFQLSKPVGRDVSQEPPSQSSAPMSNFFSKPTEPEKEAGGSSNVPSSKQPFNPFTAMKQAEIVNTQENKPASPFPFGAPPVAAYKEQEASSPHKASLNPFQSLQSSVGVNISSQSQELKSAMIPSQSNGSSLFNVFQPSTAAGSEQTQASGSVSSFQLSKSVGAERSQSPSTFNPFQSLNSAEGQKPAAGFTQSSGHSGSLFQTFKPGTEGSSDVNRSSPGLAPKSSSHTPQNVHERPQEGKPESPPPKENMFAPASIPASQHTQPAKKSDTPLQPNNVYSKTNGFGNGTEKANQSGAGEGKKSPSETSTLFATSLEQASASASKPSANSGPFQSQRERPTLSPTKPTAPPQRTGEEVSTTAMSSKSAPDPFMVKVKSHGASNIPHELDNDDFADFDKSYRLRSLNARFKKQIAELDPDLHDFEPIIRFYASQRAAIGHPLGGLYHRVKAGEKRKTEEPDRVEAEPNAAKRTKLDTSAASFDQQPDRPVLGFSAITSVSTTPQPAVADSAQMEANHSSIHMITTTNDSKTPQPAMSTSNTSNVFKGMLSSAGQSSFGTPGRLPTTFSPSKSTSAMSLSNHTEQPAQLPAFQSFTSTNSKLSTFQADTQSTGKAAAFSSSKAVQSPSQLFQPKPAAGSTLEPPKFTVAGGTDFMAAFAAQAKKNAAKMEADNKAKRKAEDFDSDEDDEAEYERRVAEEDRAKRAKIEAIARTGTGFTPVLSSASSANGASPAAEQDGESTRDASGEGSGRSEDDEESESDEGRHNGEDDDDEEEDGQEDGETDNDDINDDDDDDDDDIQTVMAKSHAKAKNPFDSPSKSNSLFSRITKPEASLEDKKSKNDVVPPPALANSGSVLSAPLGTGLFGSRPSTPTQDSPQPFGTSIFSNAGSNTPTGDNTWKPGSAIKFGAPAAAPVVSVTPATPRLKTNGTQNPFSTFSAAATSTASKPGTAGNDTSKASTSVFGASSFGASSSFGAPSSLVGGTADPSKTLSSLFGDASKKTIANQSSAAHVGFSFGAPGATSLLPPSNVSSALTSRATSPGLTDNDSAVESGPDDQANDPQSDYMASRPGEENEDVIFEVRTKVLEYQSAANLSATGSSEEAGWKSRALGPLRVLRNSQTNRTRIVMRSEPGANVIVNSPLIDDNTYEVTPSGKEGASLKTGVFMDGKLKNWVFKIKTKKIAHELVECLKANEPKSKKGENA